MNDFACDTIPSEIDVEALDEKHFEEVRALMDHVLNDGVFTATEAKIAFVHERKGGFSTQDITDNTRPANDSDSILIQLTVRVDRGYIRDQFGSFEYALLTEKNDAERAATEAALAEIAVAESALAAKKAALQAKLNK